MICLRHLKLSGCSNLTGLLPSIHDHGNVLHTGLQVLEVVQCKKLVEVPKLPASLERLRICSCRKLVSVPTIHGDAKELRELTLSDCYSLTTFSDGMYGLAKLKQLVMWDCPRMATLPEGLLQQLPALEVLRITGCRNLERAVEKAFPRGGACWSLAEAIPHGSFSASEADQPVPTDCSCTDCLGVCICLCLFAIGGRKLLFPHWPVKKSRSESPYMRESWPVYEW